MVCGCEVLVIVAIPSVVSAWPSVVAAAVGAATALGFMSAHTPEKVQEEEKVPEVSLPVSQGEALTEELVSGQEVIFQKEGVEIVFRRNARGQAEVRVRGMGKTREELEAIGQTFCKKLAQNYAYHRVMSKLHQQHFHVIGEKVDDNDTVHIQARLFKG